MIVSGERFCSLHRWDASSGESIGDTISCHESLPRCIDDATRYEISNDARIIFSFSISETKIRR